MPMTSLPPVTPETGTTGAAANVDADAKVGALAVGDVAEAGHDKEGEKLSTEEEAETTDTNPDEDGSESKEAGSEKKSKKKKKKKKIKKKKQPQKQPQSTSSGDSKSENAQSNVYQYPLKTKSEISSMSVAEIKAELKRLSEGKVKLNPMKSRTPLNYSSIKGLPVSQQLASMNKYIRSFQYNFIGKEYFHPDKTLPLQRVMNIAKTIIRDCLPIKCLEATFLGIYLTREVEGLIRIPLRFGTIIQGHIYWHIVLAVKDKSSGMWGALGLSRRKDLGYKPLQFKSLAALTGDYKSAYESIGHRIVKMTAGLPVGTGLSSNEKVFYHFLVIPMKGAKW
eukprot:CAMPEP_0114500532 /NCGR_PEP_ID=MMETSP0109-20121206/8014_1 /TAXON_ID=29199 /ORGANISM="Chlorarachnion reptans, Strain CCCM449" /LENGTH=336 /DNA_ID=CAMNT_0001678199 /DNA_START=1 /DNA_END=1008 /DNA_ORIENTATION=+